MSFESLYLQGEIDFIPEATTLQDKLQRERVYSKKLEKEIDKLLRFINGAGMSDQLKAFCVKESKK